MCGAIPPLPQYKFMSWCLVKKRIFKVQALLYEVRGFHGGPDSLLSFLGVALHLDDEIKYVSDQLCLSGILYNFGTFH
jgi:hypothetical protein